MPHNNLQKIKHWAGYALAGMLALTIGLYLRLYPLRNYVSFESNEKATVYVLSNIRQQVINEINHSFPNASEDEKRIHIKRNLDLLISNDRDELRHTIFRVAQSIDRDEGKRRYPYLLASDSFYYYRLTQNIVDTGAISSEIKGSKYFNPLMLAPKGFWEPFNLHPYVGFGVYRIIHFFTGNDSLMYAVSFTSLLLTILSLIPFIFICGLLGGGYTASFVGAVYLLTVNIFLKRSMFGWYDNDPYNILFPFLILALMLWGVRVRTSRKLTITVGISLAAAFTLYANFWHGWGFFLGIVCAGYFALFLLEHFFFKNEGASRNFILIFLLALFGSAVGISLRFGIGEFFTLIREGWVALTNFLQPQFSLWPDVYIGVGELKRPPLTELIELSGGYFSFIVAAGALGIYVGRALRSKNTDDLLHCVILLIFAGASLILAKGALRFTLFSLIPVSVFFMLGMDILFKEVAALIRRFLDKPPASFLAVGACLFLLSGVLTVPRVYLTQKDIPGLLNQIYNSAWDDALRKIRNMTPKESIISTWWPPGHFIKTTANRRVTFDGATINFPQGYWIANVLMNTDENEAVGILRMLNNSANDAADYLTTRGIPLSRTVRILKSVMRKNAAAARQELTGYGLKAEEADELLSLTHKTPPPSYVLIYNELMDKNMQLKFIGGWDFEKIEKISADPALMKQIPPRTSNAYIQYLWDLVGGADKYSGIFDELSRDGNIATFENDIKINLETKDVRVDSSKFGHGIPASILYLATDGTVAERKFSAPTLPYSVILVKTGAVHNCVLLDRRLARSLLASLYFFDGANLKYFKPFIESEDLTRRTRIYVYKIDWDLFLKDIQNSQGSGR